MSAQAQFEDGYNSAIKEVVKELERFKSEHLNNLTAPVTTEKVLEVRIEFIEMLISITRKAD